MTAARIVLAAGLVLAAAPGAGAAELSKYLPDDAEWVVRLQGPRPRGAAGRGPPRGPARPRRRPGRPGGRGAPPPGRAGGAQGPTRRWPGALRGCGPPAVS